MSLGWPPRTDFFSVNRCICMLIAVFSVRLDPGACIPDGWVRMDGGLPQKPGVFHLEKATQKGITMSTSTQTRNEPAAVPSSRSFKPRDVTNDKAWVAK